MPLQTPVHFLLALTVAGLLPAASITFNPAPTVDTGWNNCANYAGYSCRTTAYFNGGTLFDNDDTTISPLFLSAFNAWNACPRCRPPCWSIWC